MGWILADEVIGPAWEDAPYASDGNLGNSAECNVHSGWTPFIEFACAEFTCSKIRFIYNTDVPTWAITIDIDLFYDGDWHGLVQTTGYSEFVWQEINLPIPQNITAAKYRTANFGGPGSHTSNLIEFQFWETPATTTTSTSTTSTSTSTTTTLAWLYPLGIDTSAQRLYAGTYRDPGQIAKVDLGTFSHEATLTLGSGLGFPRCCALDPSNDVYFGLDISPGKIIRIRLSDFVHDATKTLVGGQDYFQGATIDLAGSYVYFCANILPGKVVRVRLADFLDATLDLAAGDNQPWSTVLDSDAGYLFLGLGTDPAKIVVVKLSNFQRESRLNLSEGKFLYCGAIDTENHYLYFGLLESPGRIIRIQYGI